MGSHQSARSKSDIWLTPPAIIEAVGGPTSFDLDPCSLLNRPWPTAKEHYTPEDNGLFLPWFGRVWLNPPYSNPLVANFMARMAEHDHGIALVFARTETEVFHRFVWSAASGILFIRGRLNFHHIDGRPARKDGGAPSVLISYGSQDRDMLSVAPIEGTFVALRFQKFLLVSALSPTWAAALDEFFDGQEGPIHLQDLYRAFIDHPKTKHNAHWRDKLRQMLQRGRFERVAKGLWQRRRS
ncbi:adenine methyltransferase [Rhizobium lusitanum]|uniref:Adenine methyltransferase n=2 Tax=Rhizobium lusitanum TaxID=293958 RepID=A0A6L9U6J6_9HYPH|nr:adenine methyltransferase [Rhizobium lusitanum]